MKIGAIPDTLDFRQKVSGTAPKVSGTAPKVSGTAPKVSGTAPVSVRNSAKGVRNSASGNWRYFNPILGGRVNLPSPPKNCCNFQNNALEGLFFFATFSFYLLHTICEIFGIRACVERKSQTISQQDVRTRTVWISIVSTKSKIVNNFWLDDCLDFKFSQYHSITKKTFPEIFIKIWLRDVIMTS